ncbi:hypothetical protein [Micromonospora globbae]|uniref:hypothetical protein n=1 Tax=Micromonospora globbae TaxID=1894969 RepID=UPI003436CD25
MTKTFDRTAMNWVETTIIELNKTIRYALRNTATTLRLCAVLVTLTACLALMAWLGVR